jgi:hypothetical protein
MGSDHRRRRSEPQQGHPHRDHGSLVRRAGLQAPPSLRPIPRTSATVVVSRFASAQPSAETITSVDGVQKTAGWVWRGRPTHVEAASNEEKAIQRKHRSGAANSHGALVAAKLLRRGEQPTFHPARHAAAAARGQRGRPALRAPAGSQAATMTAPSSSSRDVRFAPAGTANAADAPATSDY